jgi:predicted nuclease of predicted toxin-antitoxin system
VEKIKLLLDEDVHSKLSIILKKRGFDVVHVQEVDAKGKTDPEQLAYAGKQKRCLMSFNTKDFVLLHNQYAKEGKEHWGIIVSKQLPLGETLRRLLSLLQSHSRASMKNRILFLSMESW